MFFPLESPGSFECPPPFAFNSLFFSSLFLSLFSFAGIEEKITSFFLAFFMTEKKEKKKNEKTIEER